ncbi:hypothetical protein EDC30_10323 [Paucimonas lemoignei]|uniref:Flagellar biosynthesis protein FliO n=1 Tax=Paucimonas lemoignei TaxID=29443 RepID=A0A4R3HZF7_PAULE|nr:hypothetical protein [Paucimonas lemoignei]TCS37731.1 hypothetical protein EDC30_10323 [Paucimonas lemoignei]
MLIRKVLFCLCLALAIVGNAFAQNAAATQPAQQDRSNAPASIPFKSEPQGFAEQSLFTMLITLAILGAAVAGLYYLRNQLQKKGGPAFLKPTSVRLKERIRLSPQLTMYLVTYRDKEILIAHGGNTIATISEEPLDPASGHQVQPSNHKLPD